MFTSLLDTPEQGDLREGVRRFLRERAPIESARAVAESGEPSTVWPRLADEIGVGFLLLPEFAGGLETSLTELCIVAEEGGYQLLTAPVVPATLTTRCLSVADVQDSDLWEAVADGSRNVAPALASSPGMWHPDRVTVFADGNNLSGRCELVLDDGTADSFLVAARSADGTVGLHLVDADTAGLRREIVATLDRTRPLVSLDFEQVTSAALAVTSPSGAIERAHHDAGIVLAAEQVGIAQRALDMAVEYVKTREQFGRVVGSFQAVKHLLADALVSVESARSAVTVASHTPGDRAARSSLTLARCSQVAISVTEASIQAHGGIGYTWEHDAHLLLKRARANSLLLGAPDVHRRRVLNAIGA